MTGRIIVSDRRTDDGNPVGVSVGADGLGAEILTVVQIHDGGAADLDLPAATPGLVHPRKGRPYFRDMPSARRAIEANFPERRA